MLFSKNLPFINIHFCYSCNIFEYLYTPSISVLTMKNIFFNLPEEKPEGHKLVEVMIRAKKGVLIFEKKSKLLELKKQKKRQK